MNKFKVMIVGCGNIAGRFDMSRDPQLPPYTHAGAYYNNAKFILTACVEPDDKRRDEFARFWDIPQSYSSISAVSSGIGEYDVISICSTTTSHTQDLEQAIALSPKLIFCEKPVTNRLEDTEALIQMCENRAIAMAVNYTRCWDESINRLKVEISKFQHGELRSVNGIYNKGILNNGSHMINLLQYLLGDLRPVSVGKQIFDYSTDDATIPFCLETMDDVPIQINISNAKDYSLFEMQLVFSERVISMEEGGMKWRVREVEESREFSGYKVLKDAETHPGTYPQAMNNAVFNIQNYLQNDEEIFCSGMDALRTQRLVEVLKSL